MKELRGNFPSVGPSRHYKVNNTLTQCPSSSQVDITYTDLPPSVRVARGGRGGHPLILHKINTLLMESDSDDSGDELKQFEVDCESVEYISERERGTAVRQADTFDGRLPPRE